MRRPAVLSAALLALSLAASSAPAQDAAPPKAYRVMLVGNSLTYTNNLPALLRAVGASQGVRIETETWAAPGGTLAERVKDGHAQQSLRATRFDAVVLQEQGGKLAACLTSAQDQRKAPCAASRHAYEQIASTAAETPGKTLLFTTWGPTERWQRRLDRSIRMLATENGASVFNAAGALASLKLAQPEVNLFPDGTHPSTQASIMLALALYRDITGQAPVAKDLRVTAPLLPVNAAVSPDSPMEAQPGLAGDGKVTLIPASLLAPLVAALPDPAKQAEALGRRER
jgi:hypothetical protein